MQRRHNYARILLKAQKYLSDAILIFDAKNKMIPLVYVNKSFRKILGYSNKEIIGKSYSFLECNESDKENLEKMRVCFRNRHNCTTDLIVKRKDGKKIFCRIAITPIPDEKQKTDYFLCILRDITDAREKLLNKVKLSVAEATLRSVNDIIFNYLNGMIYFRSLIEEHCDISRINLKEFDAHHNGTLEKLKKINELKEYKEKKIAEKLNVLVYS
jgi:PAS domain S-box-containing protein